MTKSDSAGQRAVEIYVLGCAWYATSAIHKEPRAALEAGGASQDLVDRYVTRPAVNDET